jgi:hypothetical protein
LGRVNKNICPKINLVGDESGFHRCSKCSPKEKLGKFVDKRMVGWGEKTTTNYNLVD